VREGKFCVVVYIRIHALLLVFSMLLTLALVIWEGGMQSEHRI
jgi:hypothetical protein